MSSYKCDQFSNVLGCRLSYQYICNHAVELMHVCHRSLHHQLAQDLGEGPAGGTCHRGHRESG